jgi:uncharacterized protein YhhL (DUF1145 family)
MNAAIRTVLLLVYALAIASLFVTLPSDLGPLLQRVGLILLAVHLAELVLAYKHVRLYQGPIAISILLTLLFGLLHWKPLRDARLRHNAA